MTENLERGGASRTSGTGRQAPRSRERGGALHLVGLGIATAIAVIAVWIFLSYRLGVVLTESMVPTLKPGDRYLVNLRAYRGEQPQRLDIVVFRTDGDLLVKRVIGLPGERVTVWYGRVYVNGQLMKEPYLAEEPILENLPEVNVPEGQLFVMGDNRNYSDDSRDFGPVDLEAVMGRADRIVAPRDRMGSLRPRADNTAPAPTT
jgi:signal peptidase I